VRSAWPTGAAGPHLRQLLLLFGRQNLIHPSANVGIEFIDLSLLFIRQVQTIAGKWRQD
jgi:hypothetical protein